MKEKILQIAASMTGLFAAVTAIAEMPAPVVANPHSGVYKLDIGDLGFCSAFAISPDGYMLTALHCLRPCLESQGLMQTSSDPAIGLDDLAVATNPAAPAYCSQMPIAALGTQSISVLATGPALSVFEAKFYNDYSNMYRELKAHGFDSKANDFALIKVAVPHVEIPCIRLKSAVSVHQSLTAVGFPAPTNAQQQPTLQAAVGVLYANAGETTFAKQLQDKSGFSWFNALYFSSGVLYSSASIEEGYSGGPVLNSDGSAVGIVDGFTSAEGSQNNEVHEMVATSIAHVLHSIPAPLAAQVMHANAACR